MQKIYYLKYKYYKKLLKDKEFTLNEKRPYYIVKNLTYKNKMINIAIPLRSNININFQKDKNTYVKTKVSDHTIVKKGNISGWHITKMIPISFKVVYGQVSNNTNTIKAINIINKIKKDELIYKCKLMLKRFENNEKVFGAINFDYYVNLLYK